MQSPLFSLAISLQVQSKVLAQESRRFDNEQKKALVRLKTATRQGNTEQMAILAEDVVTNRKMCKTHSMLAVRVQRASNSVLLAARTRRVTDTLSAITKQLTTATVSMKPDAIEKSLDAFESAVSSAESITDKMQTMLGSLGGSHSEEINELIAQVSDEVGVVLNAAFAPLPSYLPSADDVFEDMSETIKPAAK